MIAAAWTTGSTIRPRRASGNGRLRVAPRVAPRIAPLFASAALLVGAAPALAEQAAHQEPVGAGLSGSAPPLQVSSPGEAESARRARELTDAAIRHEEAEGAARSYARAHALYCEAARLDHADALMRMGWMHAQGRGRPRDDAIANTLFSRAAGVVGGHDKLPECLRKPYGPLTVAEPEPEPAQPTHDRRPPAIAGQRAQRQPAPEVNAPPRLVRTVTTLAREFRLDPRLVLAVIRTESNFDATARSPRNAQGLMQLIPETAERFAVRNVLDPVENLRGGMRYLRWLLAYFRGDVALALAGYNAGEGAVDRHRGVPPYAETMAYVRRIRALYPHDHHPFDERLTSPSDWLPESRRARERIRALPGGNPRDAHVGPLVGPSVGPLLGTVAGPPDVNRRARRPVLD
ncbi:MAG TPA: transglycosylase SLT domain-containing protein [Zeimonas sp.]|nr:transglycosylase SLT domain-containing protein [Zeimonas sp.]